MARKMSIADKQRVIELEKRERWAITKIVEILNARGKYIYSAYLTTIDSDCPYDALITVKDFDCNILQTFMVEMKNRSNDWQDDGFVFEQKKYKDLLKARENVEYELQRPITILYWNSTPSKYTYMWNVDSLKLTKAVKKKMNKETFAAEKREVNKNTFLLQPKDATAFNWKYNEESYLNDTQPKIIVKTINQQPEKYTVSLF